MTVLKALKVEAEAEASGQADKPTDATGIAVEEDEVRRCMSKIQDDWHLSFAQVNPWDVKATSDKGIDYDKVIVKFGSSAIVLTRACWKDWNEWLENHLITF